MKKNYNSVMLSSAKFFFAVLITVLFLTSSSEAKIQMFNKAIVNQSVATEAADKDFKSDGTYLIKNGQLDEIYSLKFNLPVSNFKLSGLDSLLGDKNITFEQTRIMILPIMGMVHVVGTLDVGGIRSTASFHLGFMVNSDQSITFKGNKTIRLSDYAKDFPKEERKLEIDFVLKNTTNNLAVLTAK